MSPAKIEALGRSIQRLTEGQCSGEDNGYDIESQDELLDALDDLRAELVGPMRWPGTFLAPPEFAALQVAYQREIFRHVPNGCGCEGSPSSIRAGDLALLVKMKEDSLVRIMRVLVVNKMFSEVDEKVFAHTPISTKLADEYVAARLGGIFNELYKASSSLADAIDAGLPNAWEARFGMPMYKYFEKNRESDRGRMAKAMVISSTAEIEELSTMFPWQRFHKVVDIGGGAGHLAAYLARVRSFFDLSKQGKRVD